MITVVCSKCQAQFNAQDAHAGRVAPCPRCGNPLSIPAGVVPGAITVVVDGGQAGAPPAIGHGGLATAGFICGLLGFLLSLFLAIPCLGLLVLPVAVPLTLTGLICSIIALVTARRGNRKRGLAAAGLILSILAMIWPLAFFLFLAGLAWFGPMGAAATSGLPGKPFLPAAAPRASSPAGVPTPPSPFAPAKPVLPGVGSTAGEGVLIFRGSAFLVSPDGHLLTSGHLVRDATRVVVQLGANRHEAEVLAVDAEGDVALLKIKTAAAPNLALGEALSPDAAAPLTAIGFPMAASGQQQPLQSRAGRIVGQESKPGPVLRVDTPLNPGFSGGPWVDQSGSVVGIVNGKPGGSAIGAGSRAVPIAAAAALLRAKGVAPPSGAKAPRLDPSMLRKRVDPAVAAVSVVLKAPDSPEWSPVKPKMLWQQRLEGVPRSVAVSPDGKTLAVACARPSLGASSFSIELRDADGGKPRRTLTGHQGEIWSVAYSPDGATLASASGDGTAILWNTQTGQMRNVLKGHPGGVVRAAYSPDGKILATGGPKSGNDGRSEVILLWNAETGEPVQSLTPGLVAWHFAFRPGTSLLVVGGSSLSQPAHSIEIWDSQTGQRSGGSAGFGRNKVETFAVSPDGSWLALAPLVGSVEYRVDVFDFDPPRLVRSLGNHYGLGAVAFSPDRHLLAVSYKTGLVGEATAVYDLPSGSVVWDLPGNGRGLLFTPDGAKLLRYGGVGNVVESWDVAFLSRMGQPPPKLVPPPDLAAEPPEGKVPFERPEKPPFGPPKPRTPAKKTAGKTMADTMTEPPEPSLPPARQPAILTTPQQLEAILAKPGEHPVLWAQLTRDQLNDQQFEQLKNWVRSGGVLWSDTDLVRADPADKSGFGFRLMKAPPDRMRGMASRPPREGAWVPGGQPGGATVPGAKKGRKPVAPPGAGIGGAGDQVEYILAEPAFMVTILLQKGGQLPRGYAVLLGWPAERGKTTVQAVCAARLFGRGVVVFRPREIGAAGGGPAFERDLRDLSFQKARAGLGEPADTDPQQGESADTAPRPGESAIKAAARAFLTAVRDGDVDAAAAASLANEDQKKGLEIFVAAVSAQSKLQAAATAQFGAEAKDLLTRSAIPSAQVLNDLIKNLDSTEAKEEGDTGSILLVRGGPGLKMRKAGSAWKVDLGAAEGIVWPAAMRGQLEKAIKFVDQLTADVKAGKYKALAEVGAAMRKGG